MEIFGTPLVIYFGILTFASFLFTASIAVMSRRGMTIIPFKWHPRMAAVSIVIAIIHALLAILTFYR